MKTIRFIGAVIILIGITMAWIFFSWKLVLVLMVVLWGNNVCEACNNTDRNK